ncbi:MAG: TlpA disulfide reductase family protein [bacterium]|nr:TlpA disulfide reductase family protein [bacterium]
MKRYLIAGCVASLAVGSAWAQSGKVPATPTPPKTPPATTPAATLVKSTEDAKAILAACAKAAAELKAFSYLGDSVETGEGESGAAAYTAEVSAARADAGGWKVYTKGEARSGTEGKTNTAFELAYDGATAKSIRTKDKVVIERELDSMDELAVFFSGQAARHHIAWEIMADNAFTKGADTATVEGTAQVAGVECDIVLVGGTATAAGGDKPDGEKAEGDKPADTVVDGGTRLYIAQTDHVPRQIERLRVIGTGATKTTRARVLTMGEFQKNETASLRAFSLNVPDGYRVRSPDSGGDRKLTRGNTREKAAKSGNKSAEPPSNGLLAVGSDAPDWTLKDADGVEHKLSDKKGKVVVMDFWATWCGPCKAAMPAVQRLHKKLGGETVEIFGLSTWERGDAPAYMKKSGYTYTCLLKGDTAAAAYKVSGIPTFYVIGPDGKILWNAVGFGAEHEKEIEEVIRKAVATIEKK